MTSEGPVESVDPPAGTTAALARRTALRLGFELPTARRHARIFFVLSLVTWVPILLLALPAGLVIGSRVEVPVLGDPSFYSRYLLALPLLIFAELVVTTSLAAQSGYFLESGLVPQIEHTRYKAAEAELKRLYNSIVAQAVILILSYALVLALRTIVAYQPGSSSWERLGKSEGSHISAAGWWSILVSLPILIFLLFALAVADLCLGLVPVPHVAATPRSDRNPSRPRGWPGVPRMGASELRTGPGGRVECAFRQSGE